jgi:hypothetical protein
MRRRRWKPEQKALIVLEGLKGRPIGELCAEHEISQGQYYQWRDLSSIIDQRLVMADILLPFWKWIEL